MLAYPHSPMDSVAQLVPSSGGFMSPQDQSQDLLNGVGYGLGVPAAFSSGASSVLVDVTGYAGSCDGRTVPSSPTFSSGNHSPTSYWIESPSTAGIKNEPNYHQSGSSSSSSSCGSNTLEELLDDAYAFEPSFILALPAAPSSVKSERAHALLSQCLRPSVDEAELEFLNQIGSQVIGSQQTEIKKEEHHSKNYSTDCWSANNSSSSSSFVSSSANPTPSQGLGGVLGLIMAEVNEEVRSTCEILGVSPNPNDWSREDVKAWLLWMSRKYYTASPFPLERFFMEGAEFNSLTEEEFRNRAPQGGDTIYAKLDIWRSAWNQRKVAQQQQQQHLSPASPPSLGASLIPTILVDEPATTDMSELLACWINTTQEIQQQPPMSSSSMLSVPNQHHHLLGVPVSPSSVTSSQRGALSPYSDHSCFSCSEDLGSEVEEMEEEDEHPVGDHTERAASAASSRTTAPSPNGSHIHLWQFLKELLSQPAVHGSAIRWLDRTRGVFKIEDSVRVARLWGKRKNRPAMNYDKLSRSIRQYYRKGIMKKTERSQRLVYQFCHPYAL